MRAGTARGKQFSEAFSIMATEPVIDIDALLQPIAGDAPAGTDIRADVSPTSVYYQLKDARSGARAAERAAAADAEEGGLLPEWRSVLELAPRVLAEQAKDLEVAAWYIEALVRAYGFAGLRDGFVLSRRLVEEYWDGLFPEPDEDGIETRVAPFSGLNGEGGDGTLIQPIRKIPLSVGDPPFAAWHYEQAVEIAQIADEEKRKRRIESGSLSLEMIEQSVRECSPQFFGELIADCEAAAEAFRALTEAFDTAAGADSPPSSNIRNRLTAVRGIIATVAKDRMPAEIAGNSEHAGAEGEAAVGEGQPAAEAVAGGAAAAPGVIATREQAFQALTRVADYFRKHEPQAPTAYVIDDLVRRGRLSFKDLMAELSEDPEARKRILITAGIRPSSGQEGEE